MYNLSPQEIVNILMMSSCTTQILNQSHSRMSLPLVPPLTGKFMFCDKLELLDINVAFRNVLLPISDVVIMSLSLSSALLMEMI